MKEDEHLRRYVGRTDQRLMREEEHEERTPRD
jgi:hypothetical protein